MRSLSACLLLLAACGGGSGDAHDAGPSKDAVIDGPSVIDGGAAGQPDGGPDAAVPACPADSVHVDDFCIDRYEAPNQAGALPLAMQNALDGEAWCSDRGKRLCTEAEWVRTCEGTPATPYPYGDTYVRGTCNDDETWISPNWGTLGTWPSAAAMAEAARLYQGEASGSNAGCISQDGVYDLTANVAEWVRRSFPNSNNYDHVMKGCYWAGCFGGSPPSCGFVNPAHPSGFRSYEAGFRCCVDVRTATPTQRDRGDRIR